MIPHQWALAQQSSFKSWKVVTQMYQIKLKPIGEVCHSGVINTQKFQFQSIFTRKIFMLLKRYESTEVDGRTWLHVPSGNHWSISSDTRQVVEILNNTSTKMYTPF